MEKHTFVPCNATKVLEGHDPMSHCIFDGCGRPSRADVHDVETKTPVADRDAPICTNCNVPMWWLPEYNGLIQKARHEPAGYSCPECGQYASDSHSEPVETPVAEELSNKTPECLENGERTGDGSECAYGFCPRERFCQDYCDAHHRVFCFPPQPVSAVPAPSEVMDFDETEWQFQAAIQALDYLNFDTNMESVKDDAAEIAAIIIRATPSPEQVAKPVATTKNLYERDYPNGADLSREVDRLAALGHRVNVWGSSSITPMFVRNASAKPVAGEVVAEIAQRNGARRAETELDAQAIKDVDDLLAEVERLEKKAAGYARLTESAEQLEAKLREEVERLNERLAEADTLAATASRLAHIRYDDFENAGIDALDENRNTVAGSLISNLVELRFSLQSEHRAHLGQFERANALVEELTAARTEIDAAMKVLEPSMPESGIEDACRQLKQAYISERDNAEVADRLLEAARTESAQLRNAVDLLDGNNKNYLGTIEQQQRRIIELREELETYKRITAAYAPKGTS